MSTVRAVLASAIAEEHARVDAMASVYDCTTSDGCQGLLAFLGCGMAPLEARLVRAGAEALFPPFTQQLRAHTLGGESTTDLPDFQGPAEAWGGLYTLHGSRLGARMLAKKYERLAQHPYFADEGAGTWRAFLAALSAADAELCDRDAMALGAVSAFGAFKRGAGEQRCVA